MTLLVNKYEIVNLLCKTIPLVFHFYLNTSGSIFVSAILFVMLIGSVQEYRCQEYSKVEM